MTGRTGGPAPSGASAGLQAPAATTTAPHSIVPAEVRTPVTRPRSCSIACASTPSSQLADGGRQRARRRAGIRLAVAVGEDAAGDPRRQARLEAPAAARRAATRRRGRARRAAGAGGAAPRRRRGRPPRSGRRSRDSRSASPVRSSSSAANAGQRSRAARFTRTSRCSPKSASITGASIPAAACEAPAPGASARSTTSTDSPRWPARQAQASPIRPAPITTAS